MSNAKRRLKKSIKKLPPVVFIPDSSYVADGKLTVTNTIFVVNAIHHADILKIVKKAQTNLKEGGK